MQILNDLNEMLNKKSELLNTYRKIFPYAKDAVEQAISELKKQESSDNEWIAAALQARRRELERCLAVIQDDQEML